MKFIIQHLLVVLIIYCTSRVIDLNSENSNWISYIGCNGEPYSNFGKRINTQNRLDSFEIKGLASPTRIIQENFEGVGLERQHTVRIALISDFKKAHCAGTLQNALYVITAAQCVNLLNASELIVTAGTFDLEQNRSVKSFKIHEKWNEQTLVHNIALLKLNSSFVLSSGQLMPAELGQPQLPNAIILLTYITGWGLFNFDIYNNLTYPEHQVQIQVSLTDLETCKKWYRKIGRKVQENQICAEREAGYGPCTGDDSAPLTMHIKSGTESRNYVIGILSSYEGCATGVPHIYTDLDEYKSWIESNAGRQCDFNIHAYDFDDQLTKDKHNSYNFKRPKGQIEDSLAQTICAASRIFLQTRRIQEQLTSSLILRNSVYNDKQPVVNKTCKSWQWNTCYRCPKFTSVDCHNHLLNSSELYSSRRAARVLGGHDATSNQHPYSVRISKETDSKINPIACGGVIYNSMHVLTSAWCVYKRRPCDLTVVAGDHSVSHIEESEQVRRVVSIMSHDKFVHDTKRNNDIAILKVDSPFNFTTHVHSVLLADKEYPTVDVQLVELSGWGTGSLDVLQTLVTSFVDDCDCRLRYSFKDGNSINLNKICIGKYGEGLCNADTGNPLTVTDNKTKYLVGIASFSTLCGNTPGVATKVYTYREWIALRAG